MSIFECSSPDHYTNLIVWGVCRTCNHVWSLGKQVSIKERLENKNSKGE